MIATAIVGEVQRLLEEGEFSQRKIAKRLGISRNTVASIAAARKSERQATADLPDEPAGPPARCPGCGGMVYSPCLLCLAREEQAKNRISPGSFADEFDVSLSPMLMPRHRERQMEVLELRRANQQVKSCAN